MKNLIIVALVFFTLKSSGQIPSDFLQKTEIYKEKKVKKRININSICFFDNEGRITKETIDLGAESGTQIIEYFYDKNGELLDMKNFYFYSSLNNSSKKKLIKEGLLKKQDSYSFPLKIHNATYDIENSGSRLKKITLLNLDGTIFSKRYFEEGLVVKAETFKKNKLETSFICEYDSESNLKKEVVKNRKGKILYTTLYSYTTNNNGQIIEYRMQRDINWKNEKILYDYNENGLLKEVQGRIYFEQYTYEYY